MCNEVALSLRCPGAPTPAALVKVGSTTGRNPMKCLSNSRGFEEFGGAYMSKHHYGLMVFARLLRPRKPDTFHLLSGGSGKLADLDQQF